MAGWHHQCNEHEHGKTQGDGEQQGGLACWSPWGSQRVRCDWETEQQSLQNRKKQKVSKFLEISGTQIEISTYE